jgi:hypothetical protein
MWPFTPKQTPSADPPPAAGEPVQVLSLVTPSEAQALGGIPREAIVGIFAGPPGDMSVGSFRPSPVFVAFLHDTIRAWGPDDTDLRAAAKMQVDGWVYIIDLRTPEGPQGRVPAEDIVGAFEVIGGAIQPDSYQPCSAHRTYTEHGMCVFVPSLRAALIARLPRVT